jgi:hypothetical protein
MNTTCTPKKMKKYQVHVALSGNITVISNGFLQMQQNYRTQVMLRGGCAREG